MSKFLYISLFFIVCVLKISTAQNAKIDSLLNLVKNNKEDTSKVENLLQLAELYSNENIDTAYTFVKEANVLAQKLNIPKYISMVYGQLASYVYKKGDFNTARDYYLKAYKIDNELGNKKTAAKHLGNLGIMYKQQGLYSKALDCYFQVLKIADQLKNKKLQSTINGNIGNIYRALEDYDNALAYHFKALKIDIEQDDKKGVARHNGNIGIVYRNKKEYDKALEYFFKALEIDKSIGNNNGISIHMSNIGNVYNDLKQNDKALEFYNKALVLDEKMNYEFGIALNLAGIARIYLNTNQYDKSIQANNKAYEIANRINSSYLLETIHDIYANYYEKKRMYPEAFKHYKQYIAIRDSLQSEDNVKASMQKELQYEFEKKEALTKAEQEKKDTIAANEKKKQQVIRYAVSGVLVLVILFTLFLYNRFRLIRKQKNIIEIKEKETQLQKEIIEEKHKEITDSINYAERIQRSFLATTEMLDKNLKSPTRPPQMVGEPTHKPHDTCADSPPSGELEGADYFVFFKPKDIVSGDFYWAGELNNGNFAFTCADSTGHGVPGAIMSILNISSLEKSIEVETEPHKILNSTRKIIIERLKKDGSLEGGKDGMDCSLLVFNKDKTQLSFAAANNPVWIIRSEMKDIRFETENQSQISNLNSKVLLEFKPDKMPVGKHDKDTESFSLHTTPLQKGDLIYTLTDGFPDQFGGNKGKKFMIKNLKELLLQIAHLSMQEQEQKLAEEFITWRGENEQVDDVCIIGVRV